MTALAILASLMTSARASIGRLLRWRCTGRKRTSEGRGLGRFIGGKAQVVLHQERTLNGPVNHYSGTTNASTLSAPNSFVAVVNAVADKVCVASTASRFMGLDIDT